MNTPTLYIPAQPKDEEKLPDLKGWTNRFYIKSETSNRLYVVSQNIDKRHWGCSCMSWKTRRYCKHLQVLALPCYERPYEVNIEGGR